MHHEHQLVLLVQIEPPFLVLLVQHLSTKKERVDIDRGVIQTSIPKEAKEAKEEVWRGRKEPKEAKEEVWQEGRNPKVPPRPPLRLTVTLRRQWGLFRAAVMSSSDTSLPLPTCGGGSAPRTRESSPVRASGQISKSARISVGRRLGLGGCAAKANGGS